MFSPFLARSAERLTRPAWFLSRKLHQWECQFVKSAIMPALIAREPAQLPEIQVSVVCLVSHSSWLMGLWMARSLDHQSGLSWRHVWLDDGTLTDDDIRQAQRSLPRLKVIRKAESDALLAPILAGRPYLQKAALKHPIFRRTFLLSLVNEGDRLISIDSDVLFFAVPREILAWAQNPEVTARFMYDPVTFYFPDEDTLSSWLGARITPHVNGGLVLFPQGWLDYDLTEKLLSTYFDRPDCTWHIEQSIIATSLTRFSPTALSREHEISFHPKRRPFCVARHYVGDGQTRDYFYTEGIRELSSFLLP